MSLEARGLTVRLGGRVVLDRIDIALRPGTVTAIVGPNGAGKSTLLKALAGLLRPASGEVLLEGAALRSRPPQALGRAIAYLPQDHLVSWPLSVRAIVGLGRLPHQGATDNRPGADEQAVAAAMKAMDISTLADRPVTELSGGERARVLMARTLAQETAVLIADEPAAGLDPAHALALFAALRQLATEGRSVLVALHDLSLAARFCDVAVIIAGGRIVATGAPGEVLTPSHLEAVLGVRIVVGRIEGMPVVLPITALP